MGASEAVHVSAVLCFCIFLSMSWQVFRGFSKGFRRVFRGFTGAETNARRHRVCRKTDRLSETVHVSSVLCFCIFLGMSWRVFRGFRKVSRGFSRGFRRVFGGFSRGFRDLKRVFGIRRELEMVCFYRPGASRNRPEFTFYNFKRRNRGKEQYKKRAKTFTAGLVRFPLGDVGRADLFDQMLAKF